jgi:hypothetical protein
MADRIPYQPYDTGWIRCIYSTICLGWFLISTGLLPRFTIYSLYNRLWTPFATALIKLCETTGSSFIYACTKFIKYESMLFHHIDYIAPIYDIIQYIQSMVPCFNGSRPPSLNYAPSNNRLRKSSTGKHLASYFARKRRHRHRVVISGSNHLKNGNCKEILQVDETPCFHPMDEYDNNYYPIDDSSCQDITWYDAISPHWKGGMVWDGAYVLNHQVVSVTTDPIFVSNLPPALKLSATIQTPEARSGDENVGPRATIALDSGSSINIFKDAFLLTDIRSDEKHSIGVRTTDSNFRVNYIGSLCEDLNTLPLPAEGYYYYPKGVANILSLAMVAETKRVVMDSAIDNAIYVFNEDGSYVRFAKTPNGMYCIDIASDNNNHVVMAHQTEKGESAHFSAIDCRRAAKVRELQEVLACPSDIDLANAVEHNVICNNPFTRRDICIAKKIFGPDIPAMKGKTVKRKSKMPREDDISDIPSNIIKECSNVHLSVDIMHVNGIKFLISRSKHIGLLQTYCVWTIFRLAS